MAKGDRNRNAKKKRAEGKNEGRGEGEKKGRKRIEKEKREKIRGREGGREGEKADLRLKTSSIDSLRRLNILEKRNAPT